MVTKLREPESEGERIAIILQNRREKRERELKQN